LFRTSDKVRLGSLLGQAHPNSLRQRFDGGQPLDRLAQSRRPASLQCELEAARSHK
jgi:hypothetical protein